MHNVRYLELCGESNARSCFKGYGEQVYLGENVYFGQ
jgi:hypothetical protein